MYYYRKYGSSSKTVIPADQLYKTFAEHCKVNRKHFYANNTEKFSQRHYSI